MTEPLHSGEDGHADSEAERFNRGARELSDPQDGRGCGLAIAILILCLAGIVIAGLLGLARSRENSKRKAQWAKLVIIGSSMGLYEMRHGAYPPSGNAACFAALLDPRAPGPFMDPATHPLSSSGELLDLWGRPYLFRGVVPSKPTGCPYEIYSAGPNGRDDGGAGDDILVK